MKSKNKRTCYLIRYWLALIVFSTISSLIVYTNNIILILIWALCIVFASSIKVTK